VNYDDSQQTSMSGETHVPKIIVPVGRNCGPEYPADGGTEVERFVVEVGDQLLALPADAYQTWLAAFTDTDAHHKHTFTRDRLVDIATGTGVDDAEAIVDKLARSGAFVEFTPGEDSALEVLRSYKLYPTADGMGNSPGDPSMYTIGRDGTVLLALEHDLFSFWSGSFRAASIWDEIVLFDKDRPKDAPFSAEELGHLFAGVLPAIVAARAGFLDPL
jgi:hypothetical protein